MKKIVFALLIVILLPSAVLADDWQFVLIGDSFQFEYPPKFEIHSQSNNAAVLTSPDVILVLRYTKYETGDTYRNRVARLAALYTILIGPGDFVDNGIFPTGVYITTGHEIFTYARGAVIYYNHLDGPITDQDIETVSQIAQTTLSVQYLLKPIVHR